ncbi:hypothetical protein ACSBR2_026233 [Camellia fascicularis]
MENEVKRMKMEQKSCFLKVEKLIKKHAWITLEKHQFGRSGTDFDFASCDPHTVRKEFEKLQAEQSGLEKRVNKKVMEMFGKSEDEYHHLKSKKNNIENDKTKINMVIVELDEKKKETLKVTWVKSSSELSSGQRSLLALSLILALLLFKPAPLYIVDEFIVVSLKEGMFNNANVLFRTKFVDGISTNNLRLGMEYVDMYLVHWPVKLKPWANNVVPNEDEFERLLDLETIWAGMERCLDMEMCRCIGVINFSTNKIQILLNFASVPPTLNQVEMHPMWRQTKIREFCRDHKIHVSAYSPLVGQGILGDL